MNDEVRKHLEALILGMLNEDENVFGVEATRQRNVHYLIEDLDEVVENLDEGG